MSFDRCLAVILTHEGGGTVTDDPRDPGGLTKWGISQRAHPILDIRSLTHDQAADIYRNHYWLPIRGDDLAPCVALVAFDAAVNQGPAYAARLLQRAAGVQADGILGPLTMRALAVRRPVDVAQDMSQLRIEKYFATPNFDRFGKGWIRRTLSVAMTSMEMAHDR